MKKLSLIFLVLLLSVVFTVLFSCQEEVKYVETPEVTIQSDGTKFAYYIPNTTGLPVDQDIEQQMIALKNSPSPTGHDNGSILFIDNNVSGCSIITLTAPIDINENMAGVSLVSNGTILIGPSYPLNGPTFNISGDLGNEIKGFFLKPDNLNAVITVISIYAAKNINISQMHIEGQNSPYYLNGVQILDSSYIKLELFDIAYLNNCISVYNSSLVSINNIKSYMITNNTITLNNVVNSWLNNIHIDRGNTGSAVNLVSCGEVNVSGIWGISLGGHGVILDSSHHCLISDSYFQNVDPATNNKSGIYLKFTSNWNVVKNVTFDGLAFNTVNGYNWAVSCFGKSNATSYNEFIDLQYYDPVNPTAVFRTSNLGTNFSFIQCDAYKH